MRVTLILPVLTEARSEIWPSIKYSLFLLLGLVTLASLLRDNGGMTIEDEHVERLDLDDGPDLVGIQVYVTTARRACEIADASRTRDIPVVMGLQVISLPEEALTHADAIVWGLRRRRGLGISATGAKAMRRKPIHRRSGLWSNCQRSGGASSSVISSLCPIPSSSRMAVFTIVTPATRLHSFRAAGRTTPVRETED